MATARTAIATVVLLLAVAATLILGIAPGEVLHAAEAGAHTLQTPAQPGTTELGAASHPIP